MSSATSTSEAAHSQGPPVTAKRKRVRFGFSTVHTVERINHQRDALFYNGSDYHRFRAEALREKAVQSETPVQRALDAACSNLLTACLLVIGLFAALACCLPLLVGLRLLSSLFSTTRSSNVIDACIKPSADRTTDNPTMDLIRGYLDGTPLRIIESSASALAS